MTILILPCTLDNYSPQSASRRFRADWPAKYWPEADVYPDKRLAWTSYDGYIFQKAYLTEKPNKMIRTLRSLDKVLAFDLCDADWLLSDQHLKILMQTLPLFDFAVCPTEPIREWLEGWLPAYVIPDRLDMELFTEQHEHRRHKPDLVWFGYRHNLPAIMPFLDIVHENRLWLHIVTNGFDEMIGDDMHTIWIEWSQEGEHEEIAKCDIALCPPASQYKSDNRAKTALTLGLVVAKTVGELKHALALHPHERKALAAQQRRQMEDRSGLDVRASVKQWRELFMIKREKMDNER